MPASKLNKSVMMTPEILSREILSVQPMANMINPFNKKWERIGMDMPSDKWVYNIRVQEIRNWVEDQPIHMWKYYDIPDEAKLEVSVGSLIGQNYLFTDEMEAWFQLRWG